jgi:hypothetical protein
MGEKPFQGKGRNAGKRCALSLDQ